MSISIVTSSGRLPNLFLIGAPKCGTTALSYYLSGHPDIYMSEQGGEKEPGYMADDAYDVFGTRRVTTVDEYKRLFSDAPPNTKWLGDASVCYLASKVAVPNILSMTQDAHFVVVIRNPVDLAYAIHTQRVQLGRENILDFKEAWRAEGDRLQGNRLPTHTRATPLSFQYSELAKIGSQIKSLLEKVPKKRIHFMMNEDLSRNTLSEYKKLLDFLSVDYDGRTQFPRLNVAKRVTHPGFVRTVRKLNDVMRLFHVPTIGKGWYRKIYQMGMTSGKKPLSQEFREELNEYFYDEQMLLSCILDRDLSHWNS